MGIKFFLTLIFISWTLSSYSQILNIERFRLDKDTSHAWFGSVGLGFSAKQQKVSVTTFNGNSNLVYLSKLHSYLNVNYIRFIKVANSEPISEGYTHWRVNFFRRKKLSYEPFVQFQYDIGRGLLKRNLYGFTFRFDVRLGEKLNIGLNTGAMYEYEKWRGQVLRFQTEVQDIGRTSFIKSTSNVNIRWRITQHVNLFLLTYYQARFESFFRPRVISDVQLSYELNKNFSMVGQYISTYDAAPILVANEFIQTFNLTFNYKF